MPELNEPKICKNCKWSVPDFKALEEEYLCTHRFTNQIDLITGKFYYPNYREVRYNPDQCSRDGNYYVPKNSG